MSTLVDSSTGLDESVCADDFATLDVVEPVVRELWCMWGGMLDSLSSTVWLESRLIGL